MSLAEALAEEGLLPDSLLRALIRSQLDGLEPPLRALADSPAEAPAEFFRLWLGPRMKFSCGLWPSPATTLAASEEAMLALTCERAGLEDGMEVIDLGSGHGALALWIAERYPRARVLAVTNFEAQASCLRAAACSNLAVECADATAFETTRRFDRVIVVELFEALQDPEAVLARAATWLAPGGQVFVHEFAPRSSVRASSGAAPWVARHLFSGGVMPASEELSCPVLQDVKRWIVPGAHYGRTLEAWLTNLDASRLRAIEALARAGGGDRRRAEREFRRWRILLMATRELFERGGWRVVHSRFAPRGGR